MVAPGTWLPVTPTLSTRTVAVTGQPGRHLKLPLPTSTLGLRNRRCIVPGTLADGALVRSLVAAAVVSDSRLGTLLLADEGSYAHAGHPYLAYLLRRLPGGLDQCRIVPIAALLGPDMRPGRGGRPLVIEELARWSQAGGLMDLFRQYLRLLFGIHVQLFVRYGIALEAHQQNAALVVGPTPAGRPGPPSGRPHRLAARPDPAPGPWLRLLVKDFDGALINGARLGAALRPVLGTATPSPSAFADGRLLTDSDDALADVFITIVVHLCAGALAFGLAERRAAPLPVLLALIRAELTDALDQHDGEPAATLLRARVLDADRLPGKSMVTAGTLVAKARTGARDINKFYGTTGPNYLKYPNHLSTRSHEVRGEPGPADLPGPAELPDPRGVRPRAAGLGERRSPGHPAGPVRPVAAGYAAAGVSRLGPRLAGQVQVRREGRWQPIGWEDLAALIAAELTLATGVTNDEFAGQVRGSHAALAAILGARQVPDGTGDHHVDRTWPVNRPSSRGTDSTPPRRRARVVPATGCGTPRSRGPVPAAIPRRPGRRAGRRRRHRGAGTPRRPPAPPGYRLLPAHPWQLRPAGAAALVRGGAARRPPRRSRAGGRGRWCPLVGADRLRPGADAFAKFSLNVRITNCVRPVPGTRWPGRSSCPACCARCSATWPAVFPGTVLLAEPGYRTVARPPGKRSKAWP